MATHEVVNEKWLKPEEEKEKWNNHDSAWKQMSIDNEKKRKWGGSIVAWGWNDVDMNDEKAVKKAKAKQDKIRKENLEYSMYEYEKFKIQKEAVEKEMELMASKLDRMESVVDRIENPTDNWANKVQSDYETKLEKVEEEYRFKDRSELEKKREEYLKERDYWYGRANTQRENRIMKEFYR